MEENCEERKALVEEYHQLECDLSTVGVDSDKQTQLFRILGAILMLRNLSFVKKTASGIPSKDSRGVVNDPDCECMVDDQSFEVKKIGELLGLGVTAEIGDLLSKKFMTSVRKEDNYFIPLSFDQARRHAITLAENLYDNVFNWLSTEHCDAHWVAGGIGGRKGSVTKRLIEHYIDILDFAPISEFKINGFDQLMINYCSEKLHNFYCSSIFRDIFGAKCHLDMADDCLYLLDGEGGIMSLIDEHCLLSRAGQNDGTLYQLIHSTHAKHSKHFSRGKVKAMSNKGSFGDVFNVKHYTCTVSYNTLGFMLRNKNDKLNNELSSAFENSSNKVLSEIFENINFDDNNAAGDTLSRRGKSKNNRTVISVTKRKTSEIISDLQATKPIFVKCIKASPRLLEGRFDPEFVARQFHAHGLADLVNLKMKGYTETYSWSEIHHMLDVNDLYHFRDSLLLGTDEYSSKSKKQCENYALHFFRRCQEYVNVAFWIPSHGSDVTVKSDTNFCSLQVDAFDYILFYKKCVMKDIIYKNYVAYRRRKFIAKQISSRKTLGRFFYGIKLKRQWQKSTSALLQRFLPLKLFIIRWIIQFRVRRRHSVRFLLLFLNRREWKGKVHRFLDNERAVQAAKAINASLVVQTRWRGYFTRLRLYETVVLAVRDRIRARKHRKMANRIYR